MAARWFESRSPKVSLFAVSPQALKIAVARDKPVIDYLDGRYSTALTTICDFHNRAVTTFCVKV